MRSLKKLIVPAVGGFALSFFISLIATKGNFGAALLRGIIFAVVFAGLFFLIDFLFTRFLDGSSGEQTARKPSDAGLGAKVDITLSDEDLADDGEDLKFFVSQNKVGMGQVNSEIDGAEGVPPVQPQAASASVRMEAEPEPTASSVSASRPSAGAPVAEAKPVVKAPSSEPENSFRPVPLGTPEPKVQNPEAEKVQDLDSLPEISDFDSDLGSDESSSSSRNDDGYVDDSDFSGSNSSLYSRRKPGDDASAGHDAETLAKAIQTILKKDE